MLNSCTVALDGSKLTLADSMDSSHLTGRRVQLFIVFQTIVGRGNGFLDDEHFGML